MKPRAAQAEAAASTEAPEVPVRRKTDPVPTAPSMTRPEGATPDAASDIVPAQGPASLGASSPASPLSDKGAAATAAPPAPTQRAGGVAAEDGRSKLQRRTAAARDAVEEKLSPRVEKLRHASNVMLEEASYDPSLRFVLVAVAFILLSLLLLLLNYLLG
ncbi:MAG TPA: hypothetical protein VJT09_01255 [Pyrinomonadaceae bacterium]|nr:hypothetical protein [Pyrinomonadaceae bacterium]